MLDGLEVMERKRAHEVLLAHLAAHADSQELEAVLLRVDQHLRLSTEEKEAGMNRSSATSPPSQQERWRRSMQRSLLTKSTEDRETGRLIIAQHFSAGITVTHGVKSAKRTTEILDNFSRPFQDWEPHHCRLCSAYLRIELQISNAGNKP